MLSLNFSPKTNELQNAVKEYESIWQERGEKIVTELENTSGLSFSTKTIDVIIHEAPSHSGNGKDKPMKLRASYSDDTKLATLMHELGHILLMDNNIRAQEGKDIHDILFLFLYDAWVNLEGEVFANNQVEVEKERGDRYVELWQKALSLSRQKRVEKLKRIYLI